MWLHLNDDQLDLIEGALAERVAQFKKLIETALSGEKAEGPRLRLTKKVDRHQALLNEIKRQRVDFDPAHPFKGATAKPVTKN